MILYKFSPVFPLLLLFFACSICADNPQKCMHSLKKLIANQDPEPEPKCGMLDNDYEKLKSEFRKQVEKAKNDIGPKGRELEKNWDTVQRQFLCNSWSNGASKCNFDIYHEGGIALGYYYATHPGERDNYYCFAGLTRSAELYEKCPMYDYLPIADIDPDFNASKYEPMNYTEAINDTDVLHWIEEAYKLPQANEGMFGKTAFERWQSELGRSRQPDGYTYGTLLEPNAPVDDPEAMDELFTLWLRKKYNTMNDTLANAKWQREVELKGIDPTGNEKYKKAKQKCLKDWVKSYDKNYVRWCSKHIIWDVSVKGFIVKGCFAPCVINGKIVNSSELVYKFYHAKQDEISPGIFLISEIEDVTIKNGNFYFTYLSYNLPGGAIDDGLENHCKDKFTGVINNVKYKCSGWWFWVLGCNRDEGTCLTKPKPYPKIYTPFLILQHTCTLARTSVYQLIRLDQLDHKDGVWEPELIDLPVYLENAVDNQDYVFDSMERLTQGLHKFQFEKGGRAIADVVKRGEEAMNDLVINYNDASLLGDKNAPKELKENMKKYRLVADIPPAV